MKNIYDNIFESFNKEQSIRLIESFKNKPYHSFWLNEEKLCQEQLLKLYPNIKKHPFIKNAFIYDKDEYELGKSLIHDLGAIYIQDAASMMSVYFLNIKPGEDVLDMCAAPGGKSLQASYAMKSNGILISNDISIERINEFISNIERMGASNILVTNNDFSKFETNKMALKFDKIILDAPCSGSGMIRKDPKMLEDWSYNKVLKFQEIQKTMILKAFDMLKDGGILSYSTCSFSKEENEDVVKYLLENREANVVSLNESPLFCQDKEKLGVHFLPFLFPGEGQYVCLIKKSGKLKENEIKYNSFLLNEENLKNRSNIIFKNFKYSLPKEIDFKNLHVIRYGLKEEEIIKDIHKYDYHLSHALKSFNNEVNVSKEELKKIIHGDVISKNNKSWVLLKYNDISICFGKGDGRIIKNHYPKGLRH